MLPESFIIDADKVLARFGKWPHFHDMEVVSLHMDRHGPAGPSIEFVVFAWNYTGRIAPQGHYEQCTHSLIRFRCDRVRSNQFNDFNHQNVLDGLEFSLSADESKSVKVVLPSIYGLGGSFSCASVRVVDVAPATRDGQPVSDG
jgi:hypothetical protein